MKKYIYLTLILFATFLIAPIGLNAAYNDVTLTTDAVLSVNGISLSVSGSSAVVESITVNSTSFSVTLQTDSTFTVTSSARATFSVSSPKTIQSSTSCTSSASSLTLSGGNDVAVSVTPTSTTCDTNTSITSSSGGGGGGGGSASAPGVITTTSSQDTIVTTTEDITTTDKKTIKAVSSSSSITKGQIDSIIGLLKAFNAEQSVIDNVMLSLAGSSSSVVATKPSGVSTMFTKGLSRGASNSDVKRLQQLLNSDPDTRIAESGVGSAGNETNFFGLMTEKAVQKFQMKHGVVSGPSDAGYGYIGPKTRAKLTEVFGQ